MSIEQMIRVALCDDDEIILKYLCKIVEDILKQTSCSFYLQTYISAQQLLNEGNKYDLIFLDIEMPEIDGIEMGNIIHKNMPECKIIMATGKIERFKETFKFGTFRFITKPFEEEEIREAIDAYCHQRIGMEEIDIYRKRNRVYVRQREIEYIEAYNGYVELCVKREIYRKDTYLKELQEHLDERCFFRINKKYIINMFFVERYVEGRIYYKDKNFVVSRRRKKDFEKAYIEFDLNYR